MKILQVNQQQHCQICIKKVKFQYLKSQFKQMSSKQKQAEYRENLIGNDFIITPNDNQIRVYVAGEILSANNFPNEEIFISYKFSLPQGWKTEFPEQYSNLHLTEEELKEINCLESITQSVLPVIVHKQEGGVTNQFYFCFPFDLQLITTETAASKQWPKILFQVFSKDSWDRIYMHGCGFINLPPKEGMHQLKSQTWKPTLTQSKKISEFFLGGLIRPKNIEDIASHFDKNELDKQSPINRSQFYTESSGSVSFRVNIASQSKKVKMDERMNFKTYKLSEQTQVRRNQLSSSDLNSVPSNYNTELGTGARFANTRLL